MLAITTRFHGGTGRLSATVEGRRVYMYASEADQNPNPNMTNDAWRHLAVAKKFVAEKLSVSRQQGELIGGWTDRGMVWVFADSHDRG